MLFQVAGKTGNGVLEAACEAGLHGIGVDVDQWLSLTADTDPDVQCIVTSAEKQLADDGSRDRSIRSPTARRPERWRR